MREEITSVYVYNATIGPVSSTTVGQIGQLFTESSQFDETKAIASDCDVFARARAYLIVVECQEKKVAGARSFVEVGAIFVCFHTSELEASATGGGTSLTLPAQSLYRSMIE